MAPLWRKWRIPLLLIGCLLAVGFWEAMARWSRRPFQAFELTAADFAGFLPAVSNALVRPVPTVADDPTAPALVALALSDPSGADTLVRLIHGYNMPMCMKIKGYTVDLIEERWEVAAGGAKGEKADKRQIWRLTSETGARFIWATQMLRAADLAGTPVDIRTMAFPRVATREDPRWMPRGLSWRSLRHPWANTRAFLRAQWNNARCDWAAFLRLRQPAWASAELLTLVGAGLQEAADSGAEAAAIARTVAAQDFVLTELRRWRATATP
jgi:hypothetical protein